MQEEVITKLLQHSNPYSNFMVANIPSTQEEVTAKFQKKMIDAYNNYVTDFVSKDVGYLFEKKM
jgi:hypothetical protein